jgi:hypothetical protein
MPKFGSPFPMAIPPRDDAQETPISVQAEAAPGEVALDAVIRAQSTAPQISQRINDLENCIWALAEYLERHRMDEEGLTLIRRAKEVLKSQLEIDDASRNSEESTKRADR